MSCDAEPREVVALVMAAGVASRFGSDKRRHVMADGRTMLATTLGAILPAYPRVCLVVRPGEPLAWLTPEAAGGIQRLEAPNAGRGLGASLGDAFRELNRHGETAVAAAVILADMPWLTTRTCERLNRHAETGRIVIPQHAGRRGHPVLFGRNFWKELASLEGGEGAREVVARHRQAMALIDVDDAGIWRDVDFPGDLPDGG